MQTVYSVPYSMTSVHNGATWGESANDETISQRGSRVRIMELRGKGSVIQALVTPSRVISRPDTGAYDFGRRHRASYDSHPCAAIDCITTAVFPFI